MSTTALPRITEIQRKQYREEGYMILERVISEEHLQMLRDECRLFMDNEDRRVQASGGKRNPAGYFIAQRHRDSARLHEFIFGDLMAEICRKTLGDTAYLFWEQYLVKAAENSPAFAWHQDSGYVGLPHKPYLTCWCALDDVTEENGTVYVMPFSRQGTREVVLHTRDEATKDLVCYNGSDSGDPVVVPAGSIACFTSLNFHRSGQNRSDRMRRVYLAQYSPEPILKTADPGFAIPFLNKGRNVYRHEA